MPKRTAKATVAQIISDLAYLETVVKDTNEDERAILKESFESFKRAEMDAFNPIVILRAVGV